MVKAVFIQNPNSIYDDRPGQAYHFPKRYLGTVQQTIGDWVVFYQGRRGAFGYVSVQRVLEVIPDKNKVDHFYAILDRASQLSFERVVPRADHSGVAFETSLRGNDGRPMSGGASVSAVRKLSEIEFSAIVNSGLEALVQPESLPRTGPLPEAGINESFGFSEDQSLFDSAPLSGVRSNILYSRKARDASFARQVKAAYGAKCAISGLSLTNGGGRPEVEAAHIRPVAHDGPDIIQNGLALSGTVHWMFDRGLISVAEDLRILISHNKVPAETVSRLISSEQRLILPNEPRHHPHPDYLRYHREEIFGQAA